MESHTLQFWKIFINFCIDNPPHFLSCLLQNTSVVLPLFSSPSLILPLSLDFGSFYRGSLEVSISRRQVGLGAGGLLSTQTFTYLSLFRRVLHSVVLGGPWFRAVLVRPLHRVKLQSSAGLVGVHQKCVCSSHFQPSPLEGT